jgi:hypothetical protein
MRVPHPGNLPARRGHTPLPAVGIPTLLLIEQSKGERGMASCSVLWRRLIKVAPGSVYGFRLVPPVSAGRAPVCSSRVHQ